MKTLRWALAAVLVAMWPFDGASAVADVNWAVLAVDAGGSGAEGRMDLNLTVETLGEGVVFGVLLNNGEYTLVASDAWGGDASRVSTSREIGGLSMSVAPGPSDTFRLHVSGPGSYAAGQAAGLVVLVANARILESSGDFNASAGSASSALRIGGGATPLTAMSSSGMGPAVQAGKTAAGSSRQSVSSGVGSVMTVAPLCTGPCHGTVTGPSGAVYSWDQTRACVGAVILSACDTRQAGYLGLGAGPGLWQFAFTGVGSTTYGVWAPIGEDYKRFTAFAA